MIWSKKLQLFKGLLAPSMVSRLALHSASYRAAYEQRGRIAVLWDGAEVLSFCDFIHENAWRENGCRLPVEGVYSKQDFARAFAGYLHLDIATALSSTDPIVRGLAMLDRRTGRRRLERCHTAEQSALARSFLALRLEAEGMTDRTTVPA